MADEQDPERTRQMLNRFYDAMTDEVERYGGTVEKFAGDAVMAAFGAPAALEDHAERALHAGLAMHERLNDLFGGRLGPPDRRQHRRRDRRPPARGELVRHGRRRERGCPAGAGRRAGGDHRRRAHGRGGAGSIRVRRPRWSSRRRASPRESLPAGCCSALSLVRPRGLRGMPSVFIGRDADLAELRDRYRRCRRHRHASPRFDPRRCGCGKEPAHARAAGLAGRPIAGADRIGPAACCRTGRAPPTGRWARC